MVPSRPSPGHRDVADGSWSRRDGAEPQGGQLGQGPVSSWARWHLWAFGIGPCHTQGHQHVGLCPPQPSAAPLTPQSRAGITGRRFWLRNPQPHAGIGLISPRELKACLELLLRESLLSRG